MKLSKGMYSDSALQDIPEGAYAFAKNIVDGNVLGAKENEDGFTSCGLLAPYTVIGIGQVGRDFVVFSTDNSNSEIGVVTRTGTSLAYTTVYNNPALNFNTSNPIIKTEYRIDVNNQRSIVWTDGLNPPRLINIDNPSLITDIQQLNLFQDITNPSMSSSSINDTGGALKTGEMILFTYYKNTDGGQTNYFVHDHVFYINDDNKSAAFQNNDGATGGLTTNKSISVTFSGCDTRYNQLVIGYVLTTNGVSTAYTVLTVTNSSVVSTTITGTETLTPVALDAVLTPTTSYNTAQTLTQLAGRLFLGDLTADPMPALQQAALDINIDWGSDLITVYNTNIGNHKDNLPPTFIPGEVYAFYLGVELNLGGWRLYHIPGRAPVANDLTVLANEGMTYTKFQVDDTVNETGSGAVTNMGYWQNSDETYPNTTDYLSTGGRDLRGQNVRHHRMPTLGYLSANTYSGSGTFGTTTLPRLFITASNVIIPVDVQSKIKRWKIFYAKKTTENSLFTGSDLLQYSCIPSTDSGIRWSSGGNWTASSSTPFSLGSFTTLDRQYLRCHSLDYLYNKDLPAPTYSQFAYKLQRPDLNTPYNGFSTDSGVVNIFDYNQSVPCTGAVIDYSASGAVRTDVGNVFIKRLDNFTYLPQNSQNGIHRSDANEGSFVAAINNYGVDFSIAAEQLFTSVPNTNNPFHSINREETMAMSYFRLLTSVHNSFSSQIAIPLENYATPSSTSLVAYGGNGFLSYMSFLSVAPVAPGPGVVVSSRIGTAIWRGYIGYSRNNFNYRYQTSGDLTTYYYGKTDIRTFFNPIQPLGLLSAGSSLLDSSSNLNVINYNTDYSQVNELEVNVIFDITLIEETEFPNTIIFTPVQAEESRIVSWRTFLAGDRYVIAKNKGRIINLQGLNNRQLLIHTQYSLFKTRTDIQMATANNEDVFFQSASIFTLPPEELVPVTTGYAGTQNKQSCVLTKAGYFFVDDLQGKAFLYTGELEEISAYGQRNFFKDFMRLTSNPDNAFTSFGYTAGYDERNNRLIVSKKNDTASWTISYNPSQKTWIAYHDYIPDHMFNTVDNVLYSLNNSKFYIHNVLSNSTQKGIYYDNSTPYSSFIDIPFNDSPTTDKLFSSVNWMTEVYPNTYSTSQPSTSLSYESTFTHITLRGLDHCTGRVPIVPHLDFTTIYTGNTRNLNRTWYFDDIRDVSAQPGFVQGFYSNYDIDPTKLDTNPVWYNKRRFIDKFLICRLEYDNSVNNRCLLIDSSVQTEPVAR